MSVMDMTKGITKGQVLRYMFMPQILPRLNDFYQAGFGTLAYIIALVYRSVNILPANHVLFRRDRRSSLSIREVLGAAAAELKFTRKHIDQVILYFVILVGLFLLAGQFILTLGYLMINPALANAGDMPTNYGQFFATPDQSQDIVYRMMYTVFGVPEIFKESAVGGQMTDFHTALHALFQFYSIGILVIAAIIISYFIFAILAETAETGVPFGKRYNHVWAPIRLVFALGLLIPAGYGLNSGQWITLYAAKFGSDFATRGWNLFNDSMHDSYISGAEKPIGRPKNPDVVPWIGFMMLVNGCEYAYETAYTGDNKKEIKAYLVKGTAEGGNALELGSTSFADAKKYFNNGDILIRFGEYNREQHEEHKGYVYPYCGEMVVSSGAASDEGSEYIQNYYYNQIKIFYDSNYLYTKWFGENLVRQGSDLGGDPQELPPPDYKSWAVREFVYNHGIEKNIGEAVKKQTNSEEWKKDEETRVKLGWGAAGIWYNKIAQLNGSLVTAVNAIPEARKMPAVMERIRQEGTQQNQNMGGSPFSMMQADDIAMKFDTPTDKEIAKGLIAIYDYWGSDDSTEKAKTNNFVIDAINLIFGTQGLFNMCANTDVHPLAQLSLLGKGLIESTIRNIGLSILVGVGKIAVGGIPAVASVAQVASGILMSIATVTLTMGFILFYVIPFMPFLYFFFAVGGWMRGVFEAMVGMPLWALAHLRIDGEGLPGDAAMTGYFLIFEIFLRPIMIIFGLLASVIIFSAMVKVLNEVFALVVTNLAGHDRSFTELCGNAINPTPGIENSAMSYFRGPVDQLFFTVIYAIIVYMIGMSCFKLIDLVPNNILRYMGANASTFNDTANDPAEGLVVKLSASSGVVGGRVLDIMGGVGQMGEQAITGLTRQPPQQG